MQTRPNILLITTHDTGRHLGCYGVSTVQSPHLDAFAAQGVKLTNCFATVPICCASRASMLTGRYPQSHGLMDLCFPPFDWALHDNERHLSQIMRGAGYRTLLFGLQHEVEISALARLEFHELPSPHPLPTADLVARDVAEFLRTRATQTTPFYAQIGFHETHSPFTWGGAQPDDSRGIFVPPYLVPSPPIERMLRELQGSIRKADAAVGEILAALAASGLEQNTIVVVTTDHGIEFPRAKWTLYDPGIEIAMLVRWPAGGLANGRTCNALMSNVDFVPTLLELAGLPLPGNLQGRSFAGSWWGAGDEPRTAVYAMNARTSSPRAVRTTQFKLIRNFAVDRWYGKPVDLTDPADYWVTPNLELYDLARDPQEFDNVAGKPEFAAVQRELEGDLFNWMESVDDPILRGPLRTPFYDKSLSAYAGWKRTAV